MRVRPALLIFVACLGPAACHDPSERIHIDRDRGKPAAYVRKGPTDVAFAVVSDTHFGFEPIGSGHQRLVDGLNQLEGKSYPEDVRSSWPSNTVPPLRGLLITGDLTERGSAAEWAQFAQYFGSLGAPGRLRIPTFEVVGNHDRWGGPYVEAQVALRHGGGRFYSFQWDRVHFLALGEAPDEEGIAFAAKDLAPLALDVPLVLYFHLPLAGPAAQGWWFADGDYPDRLEALLEHRNVVAFFHGHHHSTDHYRWRGYDVFRPGAVKDGTHDVAVVHITDKRFTLATYNYDSGTWVGRFDKEVE